jgi:hypothetical protein
MGACNRSLERQLELGGKSPNIVLGLTRIQMSSITNIATADQERLVIVGARLEWSVDTPFATRSRTLFAAPDARFAKSSIRQ